MDGSLTLFTVQGTLVALHKHKVELAERAGLTLQDMEEVIHDVMANIEVVSIKEYRHKMNSAIDIMAAIDIEDVPYTALCLAKFLPIWSDDKDFQQQSVVRVITTKELVSSNFL